MRASVFVATYELPRHLELVLAGLETQSARDFEVVVCDDGSGQPTRDAVAAFRRRSGLPVAHAWQAHRGFRKCRILNEGLRISKGQLCVFLDGDCVPHRHFLRDHLQNAEDGFYLAGRRVELGPELSDRLTPLAIREGFFDRPTWTFVRSVWHGETEHLQRAVRVPWSSVRRLLNMHRIDDLKGSNYSVPRRALEAINGFDEEYEGYGREDTDVELRLQHLGLRIKSLKGLALQFHVWHPRREFTPANDARLEELKRTRRVRCERGLLPGP